MEIFIFFQPSPTKKNSWIIKLNFLSITKATTATLNKRLINVIWQNENESMDQIQLPARFYLQISINGLMVCQHVLYYLG